MRRLRAAVRRVGQTGITAGGALARLRPRRSTGAVQGPLSLHAGSNVVWGWAWYGRDEVEAVVVTVDGAVAALAELGPAPPDVAATRRSARRSSRCGWTGAVDLTGRHGDTVEIGATAVTRRGLAERLPGLRVTVTERPPLVGASLEWPPSGSTVPPGLVEVSGWALPQSPLDRIEIRVDDTAAGVARPFAAARPDLAGLSEDASAPLAGFTHTISVPGPPGTRHRIGGEVASTDGSRADLNPLTVEVGEPKPAAAFDAARCEELRARTVRLASEPAGGGPGDLRLAVFTHRLDLGGGQLYLSELLAQLLAAPSTSAVVISEADGVLRAELEALGAVVHVTDYPVRSPEAYDSRVLELAHLVRAHDANAAIVNTAGAGLGADLAWLLRIPAVWAIHESFPPDEFWAAAYGAGTAHPYVQGRHADALASAAAVVFEAAATRQLYLGHGDPRRLITLPYGVSLGAIDRYRAATDPVGLRTRAGLDPGATVILCLGTFEPRKAQGALVMAFERVAAHHPDAVLVLVGHRDDPYAAGLADVVDRLALGDRVRLLPVLPDTYAWYAMADAFVIASDVESLPRSVLEVMAFGVPVVASSVFGLPELIDDGRNGILFPPRDVRQLTRALERALTMSPAERSAMGRAGETTVRREHDASGYGSAYEQILTGLVGDPSALPADLLARSRTA